MSIICKPHLRLSWGGTLGTPATEVWTNSLAFTGVTDEDSSSFTAGTLIDKISLMADVIKVWFQAKNSYNQGQNPDSHISSSARLGWVKFNKIGVDGKYIDNPNTLAFAEVAGPSIQQPLWQQSSVISLLTGASRGRGSRGRLYPPACGVAPNATGYMQQESVAEMQMNAVTLIGDLNKVDPGTRGPGEFNAKWNACIVSNGVRGLPGLLTPITHLYIDQVPDVQRRRVNRLPIPGVSSTTVFINT